jgi:hypothetical protein
MTDTISDDWRKANAALHVDTPEWGSQNGAKYAPRILTRAVDGWRILDYGCAKESLKGAIAKLNPRVTVVGYDPCIPAKATKPGGRFDVVACLDVLEHVEPDCIDAVIEDLKASSKGLLYLCIFLRKARQVLPDGRNCHISVYPAEWWFDKLKAHGIVIDDVKIVPHKLYGWFRHEDSGTA